MYINNISLMELVIDQLLTSSYGFNLGQVRHVVRFDMYTHKAQVEFCNQSLHKLIIQCAGK